MAFWPFGKLSRAETFLGIDIGTTSIKVVELLKRGERAELINYSLFETIGYLERVNTALQASNLKIFEQEATNYLKMILSRGKFMGRRVVAALPSFAVFSTVIEVPPMSDAELNKTLQFEARQYIPMPVASVALDWLRVAENKVFLMAIPNEQIERYKKVIAGADLELLALEMEGVSLARSLSSDSLVLIIDIGSRSTGLFLAQSGLLKAAGQTDFAGASLTRSIAAGLGVNARRAEDLKRQRGLVDLGLGPEQELSTLMKPVLDVIINEARRVQSASGSASGGEEVKAVILAGGGVNLPGIEDYFSAQFKLPVSKADPYKNLTLPAKAAVLLKPLGPSLAVAVGAALRNI